MALQFNSRSCAQRLGVFVWAAWCIPVLCAERVDNVLAQMVPDATTTLIGMRMEQLKSTPLFQKMIAQEKLPQLDDFARESGFDPRRDVRDLLLASNGKQTVLLARGSFHLNIPATAKRFNYHGYVIVSNGAAPDEHSGGFCILDSTLAAAGPLPALEAALDQYKLRNRNNAVRLLSRARGIPETYQFWGVTSGGGSYISDNMPSSPGAPEFGRIFRSLQDTMFEADLRNGLKGFFEGWCLSAQDAKNLSNAARGMVGMGRLNTPENQPDLLRLWDGIKVEQDDKKVTLTTDIGQDLIDQLLKLIQSNAPGSKHNGRGPLAGHEGTAGTRP
jgi:hypothetical protein